jgi:hypothetical protein
LSLSLPPIRSSYMAFLLCFFLLLLIYNYSQLYHLNANFECSLITTQLSHIFTDEPGNAKCPYQPCIFGIRRSTTIKFKVISREYLPIWTIHFLIKILSLFQLNTVMMYLYIKIRLSDNNLHIKYILKYVTRTFKLRLSFYVNIKTISVRNKNVQTTVSQRLAYNVFWIRIAYSEYVTRT